MASHNRNYNFPAETCDLESRALPFFPPIFTNLLLKRSSCLWANFGKMKPLKVSCKRLVYLQAQASALRSSGLSVKQTSKLLGKSECWLKKWLSWGDDFTDKKRSGRPKVFNNAAKNLIQKAKYKRGKSTRQPTQDLASKGLSGSKNLVSRFNKNKGWKPFKQQRSHRWLKNNKEIGLDLQKKYRNLSPKEWDDFCPKYLFKLLNSKNVVIWGSQEREVPPAYQVKQSSK